MSDELLAAIYAAPDDLALRQVFADALLERGDPRGRRRSRTAWIEVRGPKHYVSDPMTTKTRAQLDRALASAKRG
jgi:uncharacterized protein (TIGR02996 family)